MAEHGRYIVPALPILSIYLSCVPDVSLLTWLITSIAEYIHTRFTTIAGPKDRERVWKLNGQHGFMHDVQLAHVFSEQGPKRSKTQP
jgi:hypothetical protein